MADAPERFLDDLDNVGYPELKSRLNRCWTLEGGLSYARRRLHVTMDIFRSELERRTEGDGDGSDQLVDRLRTILGGGAAGSRGARPRPPVPESQEAADRRIDALVPEGSLARIPDLTTEEIEEFVRRLMGEEESISAERRDLHAVIDALEAEVARRYKGGLATPDEMLRGGQAPDTRKN